jgi:protein tyrosine phosphatase-like protein PTPLA
VLYPVGIASEAWLVYRAIPVASKQNPMVGYALYAILGIYVPGKYFYVCLNLVVFCTVFGHVSHCQQR